MCGVSGLIAIHAVPDGLRLVEAMVDAQAHRGPDHRDVLSFHAAGGASVIVGHNRLSIIDLSPEANQPMWDAEHRYCIVYNGEIYNYVEVRDELRGLGHDFRTASDTEVILEAFKAWGTDALSRLNGMFAFSLVDMRTGGAWLVRDRFGVKPLYYVATPTVLYWSSTPKELARQLSLRPNLDYLSRGLHFWLYEDDASSSQYEGLSAVPAGAFVEVKTSAERLIVHTQRYYDLESRVEALRQERHATTIIDSASVLLSVLSDAVRLRLRSDVPVGISLSGGLDSSSIAALLAERHSDVMGFTFGSAAVATSEGPLAAELATRTGIGLEFVWPDQTQLVEAFWDSFEAQDTPFPNLNMISQWVVFRAARSRGVRVILGGQGADEVLMGYRKFQVMRLAEAVRTRDIPGVVRSVSGVGLMALAEMPRAAGFLRQWRRYGRTSGLATRLHLPEPRPIGMTIEAGEPIWRRQVRDVLKLSLPTLLRFEDRNSMGNSIESRLPFLDYRVVEFALALPDDQKVHSGYGKWVLRRAMEDRVPSSIRLARYKRAFDAPQKEWIEAGLGAEIRGRLREEQRVVRELLGRGADVDEAFSDRRLAGEASAIAEATTILWLARRGW